MAPEGKDRSNIPINFLDSDREDASDAGADQVTDDLSDDDVELMDAIDSEDDTTAGDDDVFELSDEFDQPLPPAKGSTGDLALNM